MFDPDGLCLDPVDAFLDESHRELRASLTTFCRDRFAGHAHPETDDEARHQARELVGAMGAAGLFEVA